MTLTPDPAKPPVPRRNRPKVSVTRSITVYGGVLLLLVLVLFPFYWMVTASIKNFREISIERTLVPREITFKNYYDLFEQTSILWHLFNTAWISCFVTVVTVILASMSAYVLTRFLTPAAEWIARVSLYAYMVPSIVLIIPFYIGLRMAGLVNTHAGLILSYLSFTLPLGIWMMRACFQTIPKTMEEAAVVDGANRFEAFFLIAMPQALPGVVSTAIFVFILCWGEYLYPVVLISSDSLRTITITLDALTGGGQNIKFGLLMAASTVATVPILLIFLFLQRHLVRGFAAGGYE
ncbi:MAG: carbohydrate ABC transporter permease [Paracoccaceae bacterium]|nr:carbohydrate ABC transporter permease [Paracoccaceae bacterium]MDE2915551.1 carbohydrate ABC transporter permease [Paracoccaceae bacterium]